MWLTFDVQVTDAFLVHVFQCLKTLPSKVYHHLPVTHRRDIFPDKLLQAITQRKSCEKATGCSVNIAILTIRKCWVWHHGEGYHWLFFVWIALCTNIFSILAQFFSFMLCNSKAKTKNRFYQSHWPASCRSRSTVEPCTSKAYSWQMPGWLSRIRDFTSSGRKPFPFWNKYSFFLHNHDIYKKYTKKEEEKIKVISLCNFIHIWINWPSQN